MKMKSFQDITKMNEPQRRKYIIDLRTIHPQISEFEKMKHITIMQAPYLEKEIDNITLVGQPPEQWSDIKLQFKDTIERTKN